MKKLGAQPTNTSSLLAAKSIKFNAKEYERPGLS